MQPSDSESERISLQRKRTKRAFALGFLLTLPATLAYDLTRGSRQLRVDGHWIDLLYQVALPFNLFLERSALADSLLLRPLHLLLRVWPEPLVALLAVVTFSAGNGLVYAATLTLAHKTDHVMRALRAR